MKINCLNNLKYKRHDLIGGSNKDCLGTHLYVSYNHTDIRHDLVRQYIMYGTFSIKPTPYLNTQKLFEISMVGWDKTIIKEISKDILLISIQVDNEQYEMLQISISENLDFAYKPYYRDWMPLP